MLILLALITALPPALPAGARPVAVHIVHSSAETRGSTWKPASTRPDRPVTLHAVLELKGPGRRRQYVTTAPHPVHLKGRRLKKNEVLRPEAEMRGARWFKLEPSRFSYDERAPLEWKRTPWGEGWSRPADVHPTILPDQFSRIASGLGVMRYQVELDALASPGLEETGNRRMAKRAARVTVLPDLPGWLPQLFALVNSPYMWGNLTWHADGQYASDCSDFIVAAWRRAGSRLKYTHSWGMRNKKYNRGRIRLNGTDSNGVFLDRKGRQVSFGRGGVRPGDVVLWERHVGVILKDACPSAPNDLFAACPGNGLLDKGDLVIHTLFHPPTVSRLGLAYRPPVHEILRAPKL